MKGSFFISILIVLGVLLLSTMSIAAVPEKINIQGVITSNGTGVPHFGQDNAAKFQLWVKGKFNTDVLAWETTQALATDSQGYFNVALDLNTGTWKPAMFGSYTEMNVFNGDVWLKIIAFKDTFGPQPLLVAPFAIRAKYADIAGAYVEKDGDTMTGTLTVESTKGEGIIGKGVASGGRFEATGLAGNGVYGSSATGFGLYGISNATNKAGVYATSSTSHGLWANSSASGKSGVYAIGVNEGVFGSGSTGVYGSSQSNVGVHGFGGEIGVFGISTKYAIKGSLNYNSDNGADTYGYLGASTAGGLARVGVYGRSKTGIGVYGRAENTGTAGVYAYGDGTVPALTARNLYGGGPAIKIEGPIQVESGIATLNVSDAGNGTTTINGSAGKITVSGAAVNHGYPGEFYACTVTVNNSFATTNSYVVVPDYPAASGLTGVSAGAGKLILSFKKGGKAGETVTCSAAFVIINK